VAVFFNTVYIVGDHLIIFSYYKLLCFFLPCRP